MVYPKRARTDAALDEQLGSAGALGAQLVELARLATTIHMHEATLMYAGRSQLGGAERACPQVRTDAGVAGSAPAGESQG
ncbi:MAG: hypothetical protein KAS72_05810 [Phycisphaerales bacterium]|nr:hypothetical protein [Phycisphaerales bacterium]